MNEAEYLMKNYGDLGGCYPKNGCNSETFEEGAASFIACTFSAVREIPAAEMVVPRYSTLSNMKKRIIRVELKTTVL